MTVGVLAAAQVTLDVNSTVSFDASSVFVDITGNVSGFATQEEEKQPTYNFTHDTSDPDKAVTPWEIGALTFSEDNAQIVYTIRVTNYSEFAVKIVVTGMPAAIADQFTVVEDKTGNDSTAAWDGEGAASSATYKLTLTVTDFSKSLPSTNVNLDVAITPVA